MEGVIDMSKNYIDAVKSIRNMSLFIKKGGYINV